MSGKLWFSLPKWRAISTKTWTEDDTLTGFFDKAVGESVEVTYSQETSWHIAGVPQVARQDGTTLRGALIHVNCAGLTPNQFSIVYERVSAATYEPLTGDLDVTLTRGGRTH